MPAIPVYVVSLARAAERRASILAHLERLGVAHEIVEAVDGKLLAPEERRAMQDTGVDLHPGAIGCYLSHMEIYRRLLASQAPAALALEDDARLYPWVLPMLREGLLRHDFDYCFLDCQHINPRGPIFYDLDDAVEVYPGHVAHRLHDGPVTTHAYLITRAAAERRLSHEFPIREPVDLYWTLPYRPVFRAVLHPRGAGVSEDYLRSYTSSFDSLGQLSFRGLRRLPFYYALRNLLDRERWSNRLAVRRLQAEGVLPAQGRWRPMPRGRHVLV